MSKDNPRKKKADSKRVALKQDHEREYLMRRLGEIADHLTDTLSIIEEMASRLRAGFVFPKARRK